MSLSSYTSIKFVSSIAKFTIGSFIFTSWINIAPANAFSVTFDNSGFENGTEYDSWSTTGDASIQDNTFQVNPIEGSSQALVTTGRHTIVDDPSEPASTFNFSDVNPVTATSDSNAAALQDFLGLSPGSLSILRSGSADDTKFRTAKEGSAIYQDIDITFSQQDINLGNNIFELNFNWAHLSNDGVDPLLGEQDFSFFTVYDTASSIGDRSINVLDGSGANVDIPHSGGSDFQDINVAHYDTNNVFSYTSEPITIPGTYTYRVGFGVVDVDGLDRTSGLLLDDFDVEQVPFDFSPSGGMAIIFTLVGFRHIKRRVKHHHES